MTIQISKCVFTGRKFLNHETQIKDKYKTDSLFLTIPWLNNLMTTKQIKLFNWLKFYADWLLNVCCWVECKDVQTGKLAAIFYLNWSRSYAACLAVNHLQVSWFQDILLFCRQTYSKLILFFQFPLPKN